MIKTIKKTLREMEIQFTNIDNLWVAEFEVTSDFNLHLERDTEGRLDVYQRTAGGDYEYIYDIGYLNRRTVYDNDFQALVYPKWIKIKSAVKPLIATITTDGEVNEVVYQAKEIEITSNGTTKVTADTGYTALGSVNVKVNVPQSGGGSGESGSTMEYLDISGLESDLKPQVLMVAALLIKYNGAIVPLAPLVLEIGSSVLNKINYIATDFNVEIAMQGEMIHKLKDIIPDSDSIPRITKEEFYNLNA